MRTTSFDNSDSYSVKNCQNQNNVIDGQKAKYIFGL